MRKHTKVLPSKINLYTRQPFFRVVNLFLSNKQKHFYDNSRCRGLKERPIFTVTAITLIISNSKAAEKNKPFFSLSAIICLLFFMSFSHYFSAIELHKSRKNYLVDYECINLQSYFLIKRNLILLYSIKRQFTIGENSC